MLTDYIMLLLLAQKNSILLISSITTLLTCVDVFQFSEEIKAKEDGGERIRLLQDKIKEMRKVYSSLKAEVASIDRKRKKLKKKRGVQAYVFFF